MDNSENNQDIFPKEEKITSSGSGIANVGAGQRGSRGVRGTQTGNTPKEEKITSSGSGIANVSAGQRGSRGIGGAKVPDSSSEGKITSSGSGIAPIAIARGSKGAKLQNDPIIPDSELRSEYELNGKVYKTVKLISASTAEARVILVERKGEKFALKLYYSHIAHSPNQEVLEIIKKQAKVNQEFIIRLFDYGVWRNPDDADDESDFELMQYCEGGALVPGSLHGDEEALVKVTTMMMKSAYYCSKIGILHRDIKPANYLWVDKAHTKLVLADFGFAIPCAEGETVSVENHRTKMYTAPEFYLHAPEFPAEISASSDVYSVGLSMLTMWSGEEVLMGTTESKLIQIKTNERLKYPEDLHPRVRQLMKGLTKANIEERWDFNKLISWSKGELEEELKAEEGNRTSVGNLEIVFDSRNNVVAHNCEELAHLMIRYQDLAIRYLYEGKIEEWLNKAKMYDLSLLIKDIVEKVYPKKTQHQAALWSVIYLLDPDTPYYFPTTDFSKPENTWLSAIDAEDIAVVLYNKILHERDEKFRESFFKELTTNHSRLELFLERKEQLPLVKKARKIFRDCWNRLLAEEDALFLILYSLKRDLPYPINQEYVDNIEDIPAIVARDGYADSLIAVDGFVEWLLDRNPALAVKAKKIIEKRKFDGPAVVYGLFPEMGYDFKINPGDPERLFTVEELGKYLNGILFKKLYSESGKEYPIDDYFWTTYNLRDNEKIELYLESKGVYEKFIPFIRSCVNWKNINKDKYGPSNNYYALFKIIKGLGFNPYYEFKDGTRVKTLKELDAVPLDMKREALDNGLLAEWIATFFQEDPTRNMNGKFEYEKYMTGFLNCIEEIDPSYPPLKRYNAAIRKINAAVIRAKASDKKQNIIKYGLVPIALLMFLAVILVTILYGIPDYNPIDGRYWGISIVISVVVALTLLVKDGNLVGGILWGALIGFGGTLGLSYLFDFVAPWFTWVYAGIVLVVGVICCIMMKSVFETTRIKSNEPNPKDPSFQFKELEALHYAYVEKSDKFDSTIEKYADKYVKNSGNDIGEKLGRVFGSMGAAILLGVLAYFLIPSLSGDKCIGYRSMNPGPRLLGLYSGLIGEDTEATLTLDSIAALNVDSAVFKAGKKTMPLSGTIVRKKSDVYTLNLQPMEGSDTLSKWYGSYKLDINIGKKICSGVFTPALPNKDGEIVPLKIEFKTGESEVVAAPVTKEETSTSSKKKSSKKENKKSMESGVKSEKNGGETTVKEEVEVVEEVFSEPTPIKEEKVEEKKEEPKSEPPTRQPAKYRPPVKYK